MAFATGKESTEGGVVKRYVGVAPVFVIAVNPDKKTLESIYNTLLIGIYWWIIITKII